MSVMDVLRSLRQLLRAPGRLLLSLLGIVIGSGSIVLVMGLLEGGKRALVEANHGATGSDLIVVRPKDMPPRERRHGRPELSRRDAQVIAKLPYADARGVHAEARVNTRARVQGKEKRVTVVSGDPSILSLYRLSVAEGRFLLDADLVRRSRVCVIGSEVRQDLFGTADPTWLVLDGTRYRVVGVLRDKPMVGSTTGTHVWGRKVILPQTTFDLFHAPEHRVQRVILGGRGGEATVGSTSLLRAWIDAALQRRHAGAKNYELDKAGGLQEELIVAVVEILLVATGALALFVGGINVMNVMLVRVTQRRREIGLRRAVGARRRDVLLLFLSESVALTVCGGFIGVALGASLTWLGAAGLSRVFGEFPFVISPISLALGLGLSVCAGLGFGLLPAWRAARLPPVQALR